MNKSIRQETFQVIKKNLDAGLIDPKEFFTGRYNGQKSDLVELVSSQLENLGLTKETVRTETIGVYLRQYRRRNKSKYHIETSVNNTIKF
jgi:hypothetical protein